MNNKILSTFYIVFFVILLITINRFNLRANNINTIDRIDVFSMNTLVDSRLQEGLAGTFFGKQRDWFILAGGSFFQNNKPWQNSIKQFSDWVFVYRQLSDDSFKLVYQGNDLPIPLAEGSYATLPSGLLCAGGQTPDSLTGKTWLISYDDSKISVVECPSLPFPVKNSAATVIGTKVYLVGGELSDGTFSTQFLTLDTSNPVKGWEMLSDFPVPIAGTSITSQQDGGEISLFVFGGMAEVDSHITTFYSSVYHYSPSLGRWLKKGNIRLDDGSSLPLVMAIASSVGGSHIVLYGGDTGTIFNRVGKAINSGQIEIRDSLLMNHTGFNNKILAYNTITNEWFEVGETTLPVVAASKVSNGERVYIAGGKTSSDIHFPYITQLKYKSESNFGWLNYLVLIIYFVGMLFIGFYFMKRNKDTEDFFKASGRIPWWAAGISIFATALSSITFLSIPAKTYATDWRMLIFNLAIVLTVPMVVKYFVPFFKRLKLGTAYEYLEIRFNRTVRWLASVLFIFFMISRIAIVLFLPALAVHAVTGFDIYISIIVMGIVTIIYSTSGGMEAVVWGDVIQGFILVLGAGIAFIFMILGIEGGLSEFWSTSVEFNKFRMFDFKFDFTQPVFWVVLFGGFSNSFITYTSDQSIIQRYMSTKDEKATNRSIWLNSILSVSVSIVFFLMGTGLFAFYKDNPANMMIINPNIDSVFPQFIVNEMPIGLAGLLIAAIFAAAMSTLSSNINSSAAVITSDFYRVVLPNSSHKSQLEVARWSGFICGLFGIGMALVLATWDIASLWDQFNTFLGLLTSGLGALFILGIFFPRVGVNTALVGVMGGLIILLFINHNTSLSFLLFGFIGMATTVLIAFLASCFFPNRKEFTGLTWKTIKK